MKLTAIYEMNMRVFTTDQALIRALRARTTSPPFPCRKRNRRDDPGGSEVGSG